MALYCRDETDRRHYLHIGKTWTYSQMVGTNEVAKHFVRWMMYSGRLGQFALLNACYSTANSPLFDKLRSLV
jgi:hypothetical protein